MFNRADLDRTHRQLLEAIKRTAGLDLVAGAEQMLGLVNEIREERGDGPALLSEVVALHEKTAAMPAPERMYAMQCAMLALKPGHGSGWTSSPTSTGL